MLRKTDSHIPHDHEEIGRRVIGCAIEVHRRLGAGFLETIYFKALCKELTAARIPYETEKVIRVSYDGEPLHTHRLDLLVAGKVVIEVKAVETVLPIHVSQVVSYLRATDLRLGYVFNFNVRALKHGIRRVVR